MHAMQVLAAAAGGGGSGVQVVPARAQMATTLGFHIILACFGIALPLAVTHQGDRPALEAIPGDLRRNPR